jgi:2-keto-4-pentenoate hydratase/2-oxohepta-3-ene-1,7-dioic acid hydratase in catechol pathway
MRLVTYKSNVNWHTGIWVGDKIINAKAVAKTVGIDFENGKVTNRAIIQLSQDEQSQFEIAAQKHAKFSITEVHRVSDVLFGPPIPDPDKIICLGLNYRRHAE